MANVDERRWSVERVGIDGSVATFAVRCDNETVTRFEFFEGLSSDVELRTGLTAALCDLPWSQIFWETPPLSTVSADEPFTFVAVQASLSSHSDSTAFG